MSLELVELAEAFVAIITAVHTVDGRHVICGFGKLVQDFVAEAALDLRRLFTVLTFDVRS